MWLGLQNFINELSKKINGEIGIIDEDDLIVISTDKTKVGMDLASKKNELKLKKIENNSAVYFAGCIAKDENVCDIIYASIKNIYSISVDRFAKGKFFRDILNSNINSEEAELKYKEFKIEDNLKRVVICVNSKNNVEGGILEVVKHMFPNSSKDFVVKMGIKNIAIIKEIKNESFESLESIAEAIFSNISIDAMELVKIGVGTTVTSFKDVSKSYKEAETAILIGSIFDEEKNVYKYKNLGIGRLIYNLQPHFCNLFTKEILNGQDMSIFDEETIHTICKFFENNLNISETSRKLYIHRNTLIYRLDKIQKLIGIDLRKFDNAVMFSVLLLVNKYVKYLSKTNKEGTNYDRV